MAFLYNQPIAHRFGVSLQDHLRNQNWTSLEVAVAWVRRSGVRYIDAPLREFLSHGSAQFTVGVDIENTSREGLEDLLSLEAAGRCETFVYHNEAPEETFHPKLYLFSDARSSRLIVGSNNITASGLYSNTEAGLQLDAPRTNPIITEARIALAAWRDTSNPLIHRLTPGLLADLVALEYVRPEAVLRTTAAARTGQVGARPRRLFGRVRRAMPAVRPIGRPAAAAAAAPEGEVLLLRPRRASETARRTQIQLPIRLVATQFFRGVAGLTSAHDGREHPIIRARARGGVNTLKVEVPEIQDIEQPVMRLERTATGIEYIAAAANSAMGRPILDALQLGRTMRPQTTVLTVPARPESATWYRFI